MNNKNLHLTHSRLASDAAPPQLSDHEVQLIMAMRSLPANVRQMITAVTHSQAAHYRGVGRPGLQLIQGSAGS